MTAEDESQARAYPVAARVAASILDALVLMPAVSVALFVAGPPWNTVVAVIAQLLYRVACDVRWGQTLGKAACRIFVCCHPRGDTPISVSSAALREGSVYLPALVVIPVLDAQPLVAGTALALSLLWTLTDATFWLVTADHRALHDRLSATTVLHCNTGASAQLNVEKRDSTSGDG